MKKHQHRSQGSPKLSLPFLATLAIALAASYLASPVALAQPSSQVELYDYTVKAGDSCVGIATRELGGRKAYKTIHKYNALGPTPHRLRPGSILRLPRRQTVADAKISSAVGKVQFRKAVEPLWAKADFGQELYRSWRVWSQKKSTALVTFRDNSSVSLRSDTILVIYGPASSNARQRIVRADLESGGLRTRLAALENKLVVQTESSRIELRGGSSVISANAKSHNTSISNHEGRSMRVKSRRKRRTKEVSVAPGKGTWVDLGKAPAPPRDLPEAPTLTTTSALALGLAHKGVAIHGQFTPVASAEKYRVEIAIDPAVRIVLAAFELPKTTTSFSALGLPPGDYYLSVAAIDDKGLESIPSTRVRVQAVTLQVVNPDNSVRPARENNSDEKIAPTNTLALGSLLKLPQGLQCRRSGVEASPDTLAITASGEWKIQCSSDGKAWSQLHVLVPSSAIAIASSKQFDDGIPRGVRTEIELQSDSPIAPGTTFRLETHVGLQAEILSIEGERIRISVLPSSSAGNAETIQIFQNTAAGDIEVATLALAIRSPARDESPLRNESAAASKNDILWVAALAGVLTSSFADDSSSGETAFLGIRTSLTLRESVSVELESILGYSNGDSNGKSNTIASNRLYARWQVSDKSISFHSRVGIALWHNPRLDQEDLTRVGMGLGLGLVRELGYGQLRLDVDGFAGGGATGLVSGMISYQLPIH